MNGESNGTLEEPMLPVAAAVPNELDTQVDNTADSDCLSHVTLFQNTSNDDNHVTKEPIVDKIQSSGDSNDGCNDDSQSNSATTDSEGQKLTQNTSVRGVTGLLKNNMSGDPLAAKESHEILSNNNHENTESLQMMNCDDTKVITNKCNDDVHFKDNVNGLESNHNSDNESCQYVDEPTEDPISTGEPKDDEEDIEKYANKINDGETKAGSFEIVAINRYHSSEENSSDCSGSDVEHRGEETVSIISDGEDSRDNGKSKINDVIIIENDLVESRTWSSKSPEVHEIRSDNSDNDDCIVTAVEKIPKNGKRKKNLKTDLSVELRHSSRAIKRKRYSEIQDLHGGSDDEIQEVIMDSGDISKTWQIIDDDPPQPNTKNFELSNNSITVTKGGKTCMPRILKHRTNLSKDANIVIIDSPVTSKNRVTVTKSFNSILNQNLCQTITSRGVSVTPVSSKNIEPKTQAMQATQATAPVPILPTLTDDMFVVEAPSFIVPYVYEKPSIVPFKEFVNTLGTEIKEEELKREQKALSDKLAEKAKRQKEKQEKRDAGEEVEDSEEELTPEEIEKKKAEKAERKERRRRKKDDDDISWDGASSEESEDDSLSEDENQTIDKDKVTIIDDATIPPPKTDSYFDLSLGKFFIDIGTNLVQEYVQTDLLNQQNRKLRREKRGGHDTRKRNISIAQLTKNIELSRKANAQFTFVQQKCKFCSFKTESSLVLAHHMETPHMQNNKNSCNFCSLELQNPHNMLFHMENVHGVKGRLERALSTHQCANCPFEDHGKGKLGRHLIACAKKFKPEINLAPPLEWEHPAKIPKLTRARAPAAYQMSQFGRHHVDGSGPMNVRIPIGSTLTSLTFRPRAPVTPIPVPVPIRPAGPLPGSANNQANFSGGNSKKQTNHSYIISTAPRQAGPIQPINVVNAKGVVMCEICDGYIKDLEQLRNHMQWIHRIKIHPKMIYNRPPLNCQKCQFRFFTDQGLERHLLGSHGLVTSAIQEAANKGKDAGRCPVCGRAYQRKLLAHVSRDHNLVLKPAHLSYKCTVCTATFGMYRQFENHVYSAHSVVAKKVIDKKTTPGAKANANANDNAAKQLKANEDITIVPQPVKIPIAKEK